MTQFFDAGGSWCLLSDASGYSVTLSHSHPYFSDHQVRGRKVFPGVAYLELALIAATKMYPALTPKALEDIVWLRPIICNEGEAEIRLRLLPISMNRIDFHIELAGQTCGYGCICGDSPRICQATSVVPLSVREKIGTQTQDHLPRVKIYRAFAKMGIVYGAYFQRISYVQRYSNMALSWLSNYDGIFLGWSGLMDCSFQVGVAISIGEHNDSLMPYSLGRLTLHQPLPSHALGSAFVLTEKLSPFRTNITIFDENYNPLISVFELGVKPSNLQ
ncbi:MAG: polyketide synthase dehydratase domain-containing protein [Yersinia sp. (in: enterobacteria)]